MANVEPVLTKYQATYGGETNQPGGETQSSANDAGNSLVMALAAVLVVVLIAMMFWPGRRGGRHRPPVVYRPAPAARRGVYQQYPYRRW